MVAAWLGLSASACDGATNPGDAGGRDAGVSTRAAVRGAVSYEGGEDGSLLIGLWPFDSASPSMPVGPPADFVPVDVPAFPHTYEIDAIRPGTYFVGAVLDVGRDSPTLPGVEDVAVYGDRLDLMAGDDIAIDLTLPND